MDRLAVINALDHAIARAGKHELDLALHEPEYDHEIPDPKRRLVVEKSHLLQETLRQLRMPDYHDPIIADAYLLYYHPSHVALAYALVSDQARRHPGNQLLRPGSTKLHIIDLAAGNLAMQFGVAIAVADAIERGDQISEVRITNIDPSQAMLRAGYDAWHEFVDAVRSDPELRPLCRACDLIISEWMNDPYSILQQMPDAECWISELYGLHKFNDANRNGIRDELEHLHQVTNPTTVIVACYGRRVMTLQGASGGGGGWREEWRGEVLDALGSTPFSHAPFRREIRWVPPGDGVSSDIILPWGAGAENFADIRYPREVDEISHRYGVVPNQSEHVRWRIHGTAIIHWTRPW